MHGDIGQRVKHLRDIVELGPVELNVLAGGEVAVALVPGFGDQGQLAHLPTVERAVGDGHAQHVGMQLKVKAVLQSQRLEFLLGQGTVQPAANLVPEFGDPRPDE